MRSIVLMYVTHLAQVMISTLPSSQHFTSYTVCVLTHCAPLGSNYFFETENICVCTTERHLESGASIKKARNLLYNSLHFWLDSWRSSKKKKKTRLGSSVSKSTFPLLVLVFKLYVKLMCQFLPSSAQASQPISISN